MSGVKWVCKILVERIGEGWKGGFRLCCLNARRIWANTPQIAENTEDMENTEKEFFVNIIRNGTGNKWFPYYKLVSENFTHPIF